MRSDKPFARALVVAAALALLLAVFTVRQALYYSADPVAEKDCAPLTPAQDDSAKPTRIESGTATAVPFAQKGGTINDASCLNRTPVYGVVEVTSVETLREALSFARQNGLKVSVAGAKHSMGGHAFAANALVLDMRKFNGIVLDRQKQIVTVQSGATWHDLQNALHPAFAVKAMQSTDIFTVGGSISVNAHGMDHRAGSVGRTVTAMRVMLADGTVHTISRSDEPDLFSLIVGGYGLFGVIIDADIEVTENRVYQSERRILDYRSFPSAFGEIVGDDRYALLYGHLVDRAAVVPARDDSLYIQRGRGVRRDAPAARRGDKRPAAQTCFQPLQTRTACDAPEMVDGKICRAATRKLSGQPEPGAWRGRGMSRVAERADARFREVPEE